VTRGEFRADLYYRINVVSISLPPLRDRPDDVILLAREFLRRFNEEHGTQRSLTTTAKGVLEGCYFPGNVRELENCVRRTATLAKGEKIVADDFACRHNECLSSTLWKGKVATTGSFNIVPRREQNAPTQNSPSRVFQPQDSEHQVPGPSLPAGEELAVGRRRSHQRAAGSSMSSIRHLQRIGRDAQQSGNVAGSDGDVWLGAGQGRAPASADAAPDRLRAQQT